MFAHVSALKRLQLLSARYFAQNQFSFAKSVDLQKFAQAIQLTTQSLSQTSEHAQLKKLLLTIFCQKELSMLAAKEH